MKTRAFGWIIGLGLTACGGASGEAPPEASREEAPLARTAPEAPSANTTSTAHAAPAAPTPTSRLTATQLAPYRTADVVVVARLVDPKLTSVAEIHPPILVFELGLAIEDRLLGASLPASLRARFSTREEASFADGARVLVGLRRLHESLPEPVPEDFEVVAIDPFDAGAAAALRGPGLSDDLAIQVRQVPPTKHVQWSNTYGDGLFEITITNHGGATRRVPGVSRSSSGELDLSSLVVHDDTGRALRLPGTTSSRGPDLELAPGESLTRTIDVKPLGLVRPLGGYRAYYGFHLGELRASSFFYFDALLHGPHMGRT